MRRSFVIDEGESVEAALLRTPGGYALELDGKAAPIALNDGRLTVGDRELEVHVARSGDTVFVQIDGRAFAVRIVHPLATAAAAASGADADVVRAPMPGVVVQVEAAAGQAVKKGQTLMVIESMKLQTTIAAWRDGTVAEVRVAAGQSFERGAPLVALEPE